MNAPPDPTAKRCGDLHAESYGAWLKRQFTRWPEKQWRDEYATPMDERPAAARQDRALAGVRKGAA